MSTPSLLLPEVPLSEAGVPVGAGASCEACGKVIRLRPLGTRWDSEGPAPAFSWLARRTGDRHPVHCAASTDRYSPYHRPAGHAATYVDRAGR